jgi:hypothetical protein
MWGIRNRGDGNGKLAYELALCTWYGDAAGLRNRNVSALPEAVHARE